MVVQAPADDDGCFMRELEAKIVCGSALRSINTSWLSTSELPILRLNDPEPEETDRVELLAELNQNPHCLIPLCAQADTSNPSPGNKRLLIGRAPSADIVLSDPSVSGQHAEIELLEGGLRLRDMGSKNGTLLNGSALNIDEQRWLQPMDRIQVGRIGAFVCEPRILRGLLRHDLRALL